ncbi:hypothetical protein ACO0RG_002852 [Hanseniaspora osmophila]|uniref:Histone H1 n=1 Tax=Hanseniaspora osmophila TaxID=56408 RepID=A0A1E5R8I6_9ASCO|nr:Histone H1 [Hanseniaspora osmophila]
MPAKETAIKKPYKEIIADAIKESSSRTGLSRQALKKYFTEKYPTSSASHMNQAIKNGVKDGYFLQPKGPSGPIKLSAAAKVTKKPTTKKPTTSTKKTDGAKKPTKKATTATTTTTNNNNNTKKTTTTAAPKKVVKKISKKPTVASKKIVKKAVKA